MGLEGLGTAVRSNMASMWSERSTMNSITEQANARRQSETVRNVQQETAAEGIQRQGMTLRGANLDIMA
jgi:hypothetical protein